MKKIQTCTCGAIPGKKTLLNDQAHVGITTEFSDSGTFVNNKGLYLKNNFCPQCGRKYVIIYSCNDCFYDVPDENDPDYKECATHGVIPDEIFEQYGDNELPMHCGFFRLKN